MRKSRGRPAAALCDTREDRHKSLEGLGPRAYAGIVPEPRMDAASKERTMKPRSPWLAVVGVLMLVLSAAAAETASPGPKRRLDESLVSTVNHLGLQHVLDLR